VKHAAYGEGVSFGHRSPENEPSRALSNHKGGASACR